MELDLRDWCVEAFLVRRNPGKNVSAGPGKFKE